MFLQLRGKDFRGDRVFDSQPRIKVRKRPWGNCKREKEGEERKSQQEEGGLRRDDFREEHDLC